MMHQPEPTEFTRVTLPGALTSKRQTLWSTLARQAARTIKKHRWARDYAKLDSMPAYMLQDLGLNRDDIAAAKLKLQNGSF